MKHIAAVRRPLLQVLALAVALAGPGCGGDGGAAPTFNFAWDLVGIVGTGQSLSVGAPRHARHRQHAAVQQPEAVVRRGDRRASVRSLDRVAGAGAADRAAPPDRHQVPERLPRQPQRRDAARRDGEPAHRDGDGAGGARLRQRSHRRRRVRPADDRHQEEPHEPPRGRGRPAAPTTRRCSRWRRSTRLAGGEQDLRHRRHRRHARRGRRRQHQLRQRSVPAPDRLQHGPGGADRADGEDPDAGVAAELGAGGRTGWSRYRRCRS